MPTTSPDNIYYADSSTPASAQTISAAEATSVQNALNSLVNDNRQIQTYVWANSAERNAQTGMSAGAQGYQIDDNRAYRYNGAAWVAEASSGLVPIVPGSSSATFSAGGLITYESVDVVEVSDCFSDTYRNYKVNFSSVGSDSTLTVRLSRFGLDNEDSVYDRTEVLGRAGSASSGTVAGATLWTVMGFASSLLQGEFEFAGPYITEPTTAMFRAGGHRNPASSSVNNGFTSGYVTHRQSTIFDGLTIRFSGLQSGTLRIYGYN